MGGSPWSDWRARSFQGWSGRAEEKGPSKNWGSNGHKKAAGCCARLTYPTAGASAAEPSLSGPGRADRPPVLRVAGGNWGLFGDPAFFTDSLRLGRIPGIRWASGLCVCNSGYTGTRAPRPRPHDLTRCPLSLLLPDVHLLFVDAPQAPLPSRPFPKWSVLSEIDSRAPSSLSSSRVSA